jgi:hypothetical protein
MPAKFQRRNEGNELEGGERTTTGGAVAHLPDVRRHGPHHHPHRTGVAGRGRHPFLPKRPKQGATSAANRHELSFDVAHRPPPGHAYVATAWPKPQDDFSS